jgi:hypothetical protein
MVRSRLGITYPPLELVILTNKNLHLRHERRLDRRCTQQSAVPGRTPDAPVDMHNGRIAKVGLV